MNRLTKRNLTSLFCLLLLSLLLLQAVGCKDTPQNGEQEQLTTQAQPEISTEADAQPEPVCALTLSAQSLTYTQGGFELVLACNADGSIDCVLADTEGAIASQTATAADTVTLFLECPTDRASGALTLSVTATDAQGIAASPLTLYTKNQLVQLSADAIDCVVAAMTLDEKAHMVTGTQTLLKQGASGGTYAIDRLGVPSATVNDGPAGLRYDTTVWYPSVINVSSSWDAELAAKVGVVMGRTAWPRTLTSS